MGADICRGGKGRVVNLCTEVVDFTVRDMIDKRKGQKNGK